MLLRHRKAARREEAESQAVVQEGRSLFEGLLDEHGAMPAEGVGKLFMFIGEHAAFQSAILSDLWVPMRLALAQGGKFIAEKNTSLMLHEGEKALYDAPAYLLKEVTDREMRGSYQGVSVPLGHGVRYRVGAARGHMVTIGSHWATADEGALTLTDTRVVYHGNRQTQEFRLDKLATLNVYEDAIAIGVTNRKTNSHFRVGTPELPAGLIQCAVSHLAEIVVLNLQFEEAHGLEDQRFEITHGEP
jgi:hypothetical protein